MIIGIIIVIVAARIADEKRKMFFSYVLYVLAYGILFGFWWIVVIIYNLTGRNIGWTQKKQITKKELVA
jgi:uncharacterized membrane protein